MYKTVQEFLDNWLMEDPINLYIEDGKTTYVFESEDIDFIEEDILEREIEEFNLVHDPDKRFTTVRIILKEVE